VRFSLSHPVVSTGSHIILSSSMRFSLSHPVIRGLNYTELLYEVPSQSSRDTGSKLYWAPLWGSLSVIPWYGV
jgi:hypothetical protein